MVVSHTDAEIQEPEKDCTRPDDALVNYTEHQIEDYCEKMDNAGFYAYGPGNWYFDAVQIIRQLQGHTKLPPEPSLSSQGKAGALNNA